MVGDAVDAAIKAGDTSAASFSEYGETLCGGIEAMRKLVYAFYDKSFSFETKTPPASYFLRKAAKLDKGSVEPGREIVGNVTHNQLREIAELKKQDLNANSVEQAIKIIAGSARSMGLQVGE